MASAPVSQNSKILPQLSLEEGLAQCHEAPRLGAEVKKIGDNVRQFVAKTSAFPHPIVPVLGLAIPPVFKTFTEVLQRRDKTELANCVTQKLGENDLTLYIFGGSHAIDVYDNRLEIFKLDVLHDAVPDNIAEAYYKELDSPNQKVGILPYSLASNLAHRAEEEQSKLVEFRGLLESTLAQVGRDDEAALLGITRLMDALRQFDFTPEISALAAKGNLKFKSLGYLLIIHVLDYLVDKKLSNIDRAFPQGLENLSLEDLLGNSETLRREVEALMEFKRLFFLENGTKHSIPQDIIFEVRMISVLADQLSYFDASVNVNDLIKINSESPAMANNVLAMLDEDGLWQDILNLCTIVQLAQKYQGSPDGEDLEYKSKALSIINRLKQRTKPTRGERFVFDPEPRETKSDLAPLIRETLAWAAQRFQN